VRLITISWRKPDKSYKSDILVQSGYPQVIHTWGKVFVKQNLYFLDAETWVSVGAVKEKFGNKDIPKKSTG